MCYLGNNVPRIVERGVDILVGIKLHFMVLFTLMIPISVHAYLSIVHITCILSFALPSLYLVFIFARLEKFLLIIILYNVIRE